MSVNIKLGENIIEDVSVIKIKDADVQNKYDSFYLDEVPKKYTLYVVDYNGDILLQKSGDKGDIISLPNPPKHDRLIFQYWVSTDDIIDNKITFVDKDIYVGPIYNTKSNKTEIDIEVPFDNYKVSYSLYNNNKNFAVDWGDGIVDAETTHTYKKVGTYTILFSRSDTLGYINIYNDYNWKEIRMSDVCKISRLENCYNLKSISLYDSAPTSILNIPNIKTLIIPDNVTILPVLTNLVSLDYLIYGKNTNTISKLTQVIKLKYLDLRYINNFEINTPANYSNGLITNCPFLEHIYIDKNITNYNLNLFVDYTTDSESITNYNFYHVSSYLYKINDLYKIINSNTKTIGDYAFMGNYFTNITFNYNIEKLGKYSFSNSRLLTSVKFENPNTILNDYCFRNCSNLVSIELPENLTILPTGTFKFCNNLINIKLPRNLIKIEYGCFIGDKYVQMKLKTIDLPDSLEEIGDYAFYYNNLTSIILPNKIKKIPDYAFCNNNLKTISFANDITYIGKYAFKNAGSFYDIITLPDTIETLGEYAFENCDITYINIPKNEKLTTLPRDIFNENGNMTYMYIPTNITTLAYESLKFTSYSYVYANPLYIFESETPPQNNSAFYKVGKILVPESAVDTYKTATNYTSYASKIEAFKLISGKYKFKDVVTTSNSSEEYIEFKSNETHFMSIKRDSTSIYYYYNFQINRSTGHPSDYTPVYYNTSSTTTKKYWNYSNINYQTIDLGNVEQKISISLYNWIMENAEKIE